MLGARICPVTGNGPGVAVLLLALLLVGCGRDGSSSRPNVLVVVMDTVRGDRTSVLGYDRPTTPRLEAFAEDAVVYTDTWAPTCWTGPSHASLFTGLRPEHHGFLMGVRFHLEENALTLAEILGQAGWATGCLSGNPQVGPAYGLAQGFRMHAEYPEGPGDAVPASTRITERALSWIRDRNREDGPWFLFVNHMAAHLPYNPPPGFADGFLPSDTSPEEEAEARRFSPRNEEMLGGFHRRFGSRRWGLLADLYDSEIAFVDSEVGKLLDGLAAEGVRDETIVVVTSDHGENLGDHGLCGHFMSLHRTVRHVPLVIRYPPAFAGGRRVGDLARIEDLFPTLLELCGMPVPEGIDGRSLLAEPDGAPARAILGGHITASVAHDYPEWASSGEWRSRRAVYDGRYHLVLREEGTVGLFDVREDPHELVNLASERPEDVERLVRQLPKAPGK